MQQILIPVSLKSKIKNNVCLIYKSGKSNFRHLWPIYGINCNFKEVWNFPILNGFLLLFAKVNVRSLGNITIVKIWLLTVSCSATCRLLPREKRGQLSAINFGGPLLGGMKFTTTSATTKRCEYGIHETTGSCCNSNDDGDEHNVRPFEADVFLPLS